MLFEVDFGKIKLENTLMKLNNRFSTVVRRAHNKNKTSKTNELTNSS